MGLQYLLKAGTNHTQLPYFDFFECLLYSNGLPWDFDGEGCSPHSCVNEGWYTLSGDAVIVVEKIAWAYQIGFVI